MTKNDFLYQLNKNLKVLDSSTRDDIMEYYEGIIDEEVSNGRSLFDVFNRLGNPKTLAKKVIDNINNGETSIGELEDVLPESEDVPERIFNSNIKKTNTVYNRKEDEKIDEKVALKPEKKGMNKFWFFFWCFGIITIPVSIALLSVAFALVLALSIVVLALSIVGFAVTVAGVAVIAYGIFLGVIGKSVMVALVICGGGLLVFVIGLIISNLTIKLFAFIFRSFKKKESKNEKRI